MPKEKTLVLIKPDGVLKRHIGEIMNRFERKGLKIIGLKMLNVKIDIAERHYSEHKGKPFYNDLIEYITSGPVVAMALEGIDSIAIVRKLVGSTDGSKAEPGTIRGDFSMSINLNTIHASDSQKSAEYEIPIFFSNGELLDFKMPDEKYM